MQPFAKGKTDVGSSIGDALLVHTYDENVLYTSKEQPSLTCLYFP